MKICDFLSEVVIDGDEIHYVVQSGPGQPTSASDGAKGYAELRT